MYRSALELNPSIKLEQTLTCAVFQEEESLSGCSSQHSSTDESTEHTYSNVDSDGTLLVVASNGKDNGECWD